MSTEHQPREDIQPNAAAPIAGGQQQAGSSAGRPQRQQLQASGLANMETWYSIGQWMGHRTAFRSRFRYDRPSETWYEWTGNKWDIQPGLYPQAIRTYIHANQISMAGALMNDQRADAAAMLVSERKLNANARQGLLSGLSDALRRDFPNYLTDRQASIDRNRYMAAANGVVDLATGQFVNHDPLAHDTRSVTAGNYRQGEILRMYRLLSKRFQLVFDRRMFRLFLEALGMTLSGRGQNYRGIVMCQGASGTGKGGTTNLVKTALGERACVASPAHLGEQRSEIDVTLTQMVIRQPVMVFVDELGTGTKISAERLNNLTGDNVVGPARLPHMTKTVEDKVPSVYWVACVDVPRLATHSGINRRLLVIPFDKKLSESAKDPDPFSQDLLDAVVTIGAWMAKRVYANGYTPPESPDWALERVKKDADPVAVWLQNASDTWHGQLVSDARAQCAEDTDYEKDKLGATLFGRRINSSDRWSKKKATTGEHRLKQVMWLIEVEQERQSAQQGLIRDEDLPF